jgi:hypothetical protein
MNIQNTQKLTADIALERYRAGETDLSAETAFLFKDQGPAAAYDFARFFDENIGSVPYLKIMGYIEKLEADAIAPKVNAEEQNRVALELANKMAKKNTDMAKNLNLANDITLKRNEPLPDLTKENEAPLFPSLGLRPDLSEKGLNPNIETLGEETESAKVSPVLLVSIAAILIYFIVKR